MTNAAATTNTNYVCPALTVIKGRAEYEQQLQQLAHAAWQVAYTSLWNGTVFSAAEIDNAKTLIKTFISQGAPLSTYSQLVQRVLMARNYIQNHPGTYAPLPSYWFCSTNKNGFAGTAKWYEQLTMHRLSEPFYKNYMPAFATAVLSTIQNNNAATLHYWRSWFAERNAQAMLNLYLSIIANNSIYN